jgi:hypothetical protein
MFQAIATHFQTQLDNVFMQVYGDHIDSVDGVVYALNRIPNVDADSPLMIQFIALKIQHAATLPKNNDKKNGDNAKESNSDSSDSDEHSDMDSEEE